MRCTLVVFLVVTIFVIVYSLPELCMFREYFGEKHAHCRRNKVKYTFDFIPPISQNITLIDLEGQPLKQLPYNAARNLSSQSSMSEVWLHYCQISHVDAGALLNLHNLSVVDLSHNDIIQIDGMLFTDTKQITYIYMEFNKIEVLPSGLFKNLTLLEAVQLNHNRIRQVERFSFRNTPSLGLIALSNNQIEFMDMSFKDKFENLTYLLLWDNPWKCDCDLGPLYEFLLKINLLNHYGLVCEKPPALHGRNWSDINRDKFECPSEVAISSQDTVMASTEPLITTEQDDNKPVAVHNGTRYQSVGTGIPQSPSNQHWIPYTISVLVLVIIVPVIIGVVFVVKHTPASVKQRSDRRTNTHNMNRDLSMRIIQSRAVSENGESDDVHEEQTPFHHCDISDTTIN